MRSVLLGLWLVSFSPCFAFLPSKTAGTRQRSHSSKASSDRAEESSQEDDEIVAKATVRIDDGGSNLTDRFKYKVNALMGVFDPPSPSVDTEKECGNILAAMLKFPIRYSFNVVGKTETADEKEDFVQQVQQLVTALSGDEDIVSHVTPRGSKFTKITVEAQVDSAAIITSIYKELEHVERIVMQF